MHPMVLGQKLYDVLDKLMDLLKGARSLTSEGAHYRLAYGKGKPGTFAKKIDNLQNTIDEIKSDKHFIEPNA